MHRFKVERIGVGDTVLLEDAAQLRHLKVLRLSIGEEVEVFDGTGRECLCTVHRIAAGSTTLTVKSRKQRSAPPAKLTIAVALPKKGMDEIVDKLTQLGVDSIIPMKTERVVVAVAEEMAAKKIERWTKLARAAAEQSHSNRVPSIRPLTDFPAVVANSDSFDLRLIPNLTDRSTTLPAVLADARPKRILALIGPEGDFSPQEVETAKASGFVPITLGDQVLRVDTAAIALAAFLLVAGWI